MLGANRYTIYRASRYYQHKGDLYTEMRDRAGEEYWRLHEYEKVNGVDAHVSDMMQRASDDYTTLESLATDAYKTSCDLSKFFLDFTEESGCESMASNVRKMVALDVFRMRQYQG